MAASLAAAIRGGPATAATACCRCVSWPFAGGHRAQILDPNQRKKDDDHRNEEEERLLDNVIDSDDEQADALSPDEIRKYLDETQTQEPLEQEEQEDPGLVTIRSPLQVDARVPRSAAVSLADDYDELFDEEFEDEPENVIVGASRPPTKPSGSALHLESTLRRGPPDRGGPGAGDAAMEALESGWTMEGRRGTGRTEAETTTQSFSCNDARGRPGRPELSGTFGGASAGAGGTLGRPGAVPVPPFLSAPASTSPDFLATPDGPGCGHEEDATLLGELAWACPLAASPPPASPGPRVVHIMDDLTTREDLVAEDVG